MDVIVLEDIYLGPCIKTKSPVERGNDHDSRTAGMINSFLPNPIPNFSGDVSTGIQSYLQNYLSTSSCANVNTNTSDNIAQNTSNQLGIESFIIPISISISINTNIADGNASANLDRSNNNITDSDNVSICAGILSIGSGTHINIVGGENNSFFYGNNHDKGESANNYELALRNNNANGRPNNALMSNARGTIHNDDVRVSNNEMNNATGIINHIGINKCAGNNTTGNGNNIVRGSNSSIVSAGINIGGSSIIITGGTNNNYSISYNNLVYKNYGNNENRLNQAHGDDDLESDSSYGVSDSGYDHHSETSSVSVQLRENPDIVHPPDEND